MYKYKSQEKAFLIAYICMETEESRRKYDFIIVYGKDFEDAKQNFYKQLLEYCWMVQILVIKLMSEVVTQEEYYKIKAERRIPRLSPPAG